MQKKLRFRETSILYLLRGKAAVWTHFYGFKGSDRKQSACNAGDLGLIPELGGSRGEENGNPRGAWQAIVHGVAKNRTWLRQTDTHTHTHTWLNSSACSFWAHILIGRTVKTIVMGPMWFLRVTFSVKIFWESLIYDHGNSRRSGFDFFLSFFFFLSYREWEILLCTYLIFSSYWKVLCLTFKLQTSLVLLLCSERWCCSVNWNETDSRSVGYVHSDVWALFLIPGKSGFLAGSCRFDPAFNLCCFYLL